MIDCSTTADPAPFTWQLNTLAHLFLAAAEVAYRGARDQFSAPYLPKQAVNPRRVSRNLPLTQAVVRRARRSVRRMLDAAVTEERETTIAQLGQLAVLFLEAAQIARDQAERIAIGSPHRPGCRCLGCRMKQQD